MGRLCQSESAAETDPWAVAARDVMRERELRPKAKKEKEPEPSCNTIRRVEPRSFLLIVAFAGGRLSRACTARERKCQRDFGEDGDGDECWTKRLALLGGLVERSSRRERAPSPLALRSDDDDAAACSTWPSPRRNRFGRLPPHVYIASDGLVRVRAPVGHHHPQGPSLTVADSRHRPAYWRRGRLHRRPVPARPSPRVAPPPRVVRAARPPAARRSPPSPGVYLAADSFRYVMIC